MTPAKMKLPAHLVDLPAGQWVKALEHLESRELLLVAIRTVESPMPEWRAKHPKDTVPPRALAITRLLVESSTEELVLQARVLSKGCSASRKRTFGYEHRIAEAARAALNAAFASSKEKLLQEVGEALGKVEEHHVCVHAIRAIYGKEREIRREMMAAAVGESAD